MKSEKGVTLISLTIYIIVFTIVIGVVAIMTKYFYANLKDVNTELNPIAEYTTFNTFFSKEVNENGIKVLKYGEENEQNYIVFDDEVQYTFVKNNKGIYRNKVKICSNIDKCTFSVPENTENGKQTVTVEFTSGNYSIKQTYTLKN